MYCWVRCCSSCTYISDLRGNEIKIYLRKTNLVDSHWLLCFADFFLQHKKINAIFLPLYSLRTIPDTNKDTRMLEKNTIIRKWAWHFKHSNMKVKLDLCCDNIIMLLLLILFLSLWYSRFENLLGTFNGGAGKCTKGKRDDCLYSSQSRSTSERAMISEIVKQSGANAPSSPFQQWITSAPSLSQIVIFPNCLHLRIINFGFWCIINLLSIAIL